MSQQQSSSSGASTGGTASTLAHARAAAAAAASLASARAAAATTAVPAQTPTTGNDAPPVRQYCKSVSFHPSSVTLAKVVQESKRYLSSSYFQAACVTAGLRKPAFTWHDPSSALLQLMQDKLSALLKTVQERNDEALLQQQYEYSDDEEEEEKVPVEKPPALQQLLVKMGVVFHGTAEANVSNILEQGLDPKKRAGQAYGPGEYFGVDPSISVSYCKGGKEMLVFLCVAEHNATPKKDDICEKDPRRYGRCRAPSNMLVVEETAFQLPLGVVRFESVDHDAMNRSRQSRDQLKQLNALAVIEEAKAAEAELKSVIIQNLIIHDIQLAGHKFKSATVELSLKSQQEIGYYAYQSFDMEFVNHYFENGLPDKDQCRPENFEAEIVNADDQRKAAQTARSNVAEAMKNRHHTQL